MTSAKSEILSRIKSAQKSAHMPASVSVPREYLTSGTTDPKALRELLVDRLTDYKAEVHVCDNPALATTMVDILNGRDCHTVRFAPGMDAQLFATFSGDAQRDDDAIDPRTLDAADAVITESLTACAQTGTIVLESSATNGRRALTLVPDRHICVVRSKDIVFGVPEMVARMNPERPITLVSGPSATSDIELSRVEGVHGPRDLIVIIVK